MEIYQDMFNSLTVPCFVLEPKAGQFLIRDANKEYMNALARRRKKLIGMCISEVFPENPEHLGSGWEEIYNSLNRAFMNGEQVSIEALRYDMLIRETEEFEEAYWQIDTIPVKDETSGRVSYLLFVARDKTSEILEKMV